MSLDPSFSFDLYPGLDAELEAAFRRNVAEGTASPEALANGGLAAVIAQNLENEQSGVIEVVGGDFKEKLLESWDATKELYDAGGVQLPELTSPLFGDINWESVATQYGAMLQHDLQPEIVISCGGLSINEWKNIYAKLPGTQNGGLYVNEDLEDYWLDINPVSYQVSVIAATPEPSVLNVSHDLREGDAEDFAKIASIFNGALGIDGKQEIRNSYPTIDDYLTLQALRLKAGKEPLDKETYTWLQGTFSNDEKAPYAVWDPDIGQVYVYWDEPGNRDDNFGVRPAVRGVEF